MRARWRWLTVAVAAAAVLGTAVAVDVRPAAPVDVPAVELRDRVLASAQRPYQGYAETTGRLGLPPLPQLDDVAALLSGSTRLRTWHASPQRWRVDELTAAGERGTYHDAGRDYVWDFAADQLTEIVGQAPARPPRPADLLPPDLARRLLAAARDDELAPLRARRVAGIDAAGLRLVPADEASTVGSVDVWADPGSGLPLWVDITAKGATTAVLTSRLLEVDLVMPAPNVLLPPIGARSGRVRTSATDLAALLESVDAEPAPGRLAGRDRAGVVSGVGDGTVVRATGAGVYGAGVSGFALVPLTGRVAGELARAARAAGGVEAEVSAGATAVRLQSSLVTVVVVRFGGGRPAYLLVGAVTAAVLDEAAADLVAGAGR